MGDQGRAGIGSIWGLEFFGTKALPPFCVFGGYRWVAVWMPFLVAKILQASRAKPDVTPQAALVGCEFCMVSQVPSSIRCAV